MATVPNKDGQGIIANGAVGVTDPPYANPNRTGTGVPAIAPLYVGERWQDTATGSIYQAFGLAATAWARIN